MSICASYLKEILQGVHHPDDVYKLALFADGTKLDWSVETYDPNGEVSGDGYEAGGKVLEGFSVSSVGKIAWLAFDSPIVWPNATITARYGLIYNSSRRDNAVAVIDFLMNKSSTNGNFKVDFPNQGMGLIRITGP